ncbi:hypothetical protein OHA21_43850 [Actinoplanes sp. NBC_00393]|uniref:hypothetical protein n=1 Tax=Actinoplanes sp. NBC_00393 TaxID=2975953 RepID=UPI002E2180DC
MIGLLVTENQQLRLIAKALGEQENGKELRRELAKEIRLALAPAAKEARAGIKAMPSAGTLPSDGPPLRATIARRVRAQAKLSGRYVGARVRVGKKNMPRDFAMAARRTNRRKGWRHPVHGNTNNWVTQTGNPGWFDDPMRRGKPRYRRAVLEAMDRIARKITRKV